LAIADPGYNGPHGYIADRNRVVMQTYSNFGTLETDVSRSPARPRLWNSLIPAGNGHRLWQFKRLLYLLVWTLRSRHIVFVYTAHLELFLQAKTDLRYLDFVISGLFVKLLMTILIYYK